MTWPIFGDHQLKLASIRRIMASRDDIVVAIVGGALLEEAVERTLKERMRRSTAVQKRLFDIAKPLASTTAQIDALYMLWGIEGDVRKTMLSVYRIRNFFAHNLGASFDSQDSKLTKEFPKLDLHEELNNYPDPRSGIPTSRPIENIETNRDRFITNLKLCLNYLMQDRCRHVAHSTEAVSQHELRGLFDGPNS